MFPSTEFEITTGLSKDDVEKRLKMQSGGVSGVKNRNQLIYQGKVEDGCFNLERKYHLGGPKKKKGHAWIVLDGVIEEGDPTKLNVKMGFERPSPAIILTGAAAYILIFLALFFQQKLEPHTIITGVLGITAGLVFAVHLVFAAAAQAEVRFLDMLLQKDKERRKE